MIERLGQTARGEVVFDHVSFSYGEEPILKDVSFRVAPGERVALVGHTGAGKTTVLKLLARLYQPQSGSIRIDGVDVRDIDAAELRRQMAFVLQDVFLFDGDLRYNIVLGDEVAGPGPRQRGRRHPRPSAGRPAARRLSARR